jgi:putative ATPase
VARSRSRGTPHDQPTLLARAVERGALGGAPAPLAERMRPRSLDDVVGQEQLLARGKPLREAIESDRMPSIILWGPPGSGKTTLANVIAARTRTEFVAFSAVLGGVQELRVIVEQARERRSYQGLGTTLFVDEIHRFNKAQQDAFLPHLEQGTIVLIGATTENPSFAVNAALLSRCRVFRLDALADASLIALLERALHDQDRGLGRLGISAEKEGLELIAKTARGDARRALGLLEVAAALAPAASSTVLSSSARVSTRRSSTTRPGRSTTTSRARSSSRCAAATPTAPSTGCFVCSTRETTRSSCCVE